MGILTGNPKENPLHYGEIFDIWSFSKMAKGCLSAYGAFLNHAGDKDVKRLLEAAIDQASTIAAECDDILKDHGIMPPPALPERAKAEWADIPAGARFSDMEIAAAMTADHAAGLVACSQVMGKCVREDIAALFAKYHDAKAALNLRLLRLNKEKGWLVPPPLQIKRPEPVEV